MEFKKVVLLGGGVLGTQIALMCAYTGHDTTIWLRSEGSIGRTQPKIEYYTKAILDALEQAKKFVGNPLGAYVYPKALIRDALIAEGKKNMKDNLHLELDAKKALSDADIAIEAMAENTEEKITFYESIKGILDDKTILCTNSSTLLPSAFAEHTGRPEKYMALHFANSIWAHNTAECMGHAGTDPDIYKQVVQFAKDINMEPIEVHKEQPGYVLNSLLVPLLDAGQNLWARGIADPETIDKAWRIGTGAPVGPFQMMDVIGLQTVSNVLKMKPDAKDPESVTYRLIKMVGEKIEKGELGVAAGKGFYDYTE